MADTEKIVFREDTLRILEGFRLLDDDFMTIVFEGKYTSCYLASEYYP